jgi:hypothetical protein
MLLSEYVLLRVFFISRNITAITEELDMMQKMIQIFRSSLIINPAYMYNNCEETTYVQEYLS